VILSIRSDWDRAVSERSGCRWVENSTLVRRTDLEWTPHFCEKSAHSFSFCTEMALIHALKQRSHDTKCMNNKENDGILENEAGLRPSSFLSPFFLHFAQLPAYSSCHVGVTSLQAGVDK